MQGGRVDRHNLPAIQSIRVHAPAHLDAVPVSVDRLDLPGPTNRLTLHGAKGDDDGVFAFVVDQQDRRLVLLLAVEDEPGRDRPRRVGDLDLDVEDRLSESVANAEAGPTRGDAWRDLEAVADPVQAEQEKKRKQLIKILAEIEKRINEENARPKKRYISPATREEVYAIYYDSLRRKIEDKGTSNFPELAGKKLYGELTMIVTVNFDGRVLATEVVETSGNLTLDRRAQTIVKGTGPFDRFTDAMRRKADQIVVVSRFKFTRDETLETKLTNR